MGQTRKARSKTNSGVDLHRGNRTSIPVRKRTRRQRNNRGDNIARGIGNNLSADKGVLIPVTSELKYRLLLWWCAVGIMVLILFNVGDHVGWW